MKLNRHHWVTVVKRSSIQSVIVIYSFIKVVFKMKCPFSFLYSVKKISPKSVTHISFFFLFFFTMHFWTSVMYARCNNKVYFG